ncbi:MAG: MFS transporter [Promethearchaeota archaeon]
MLTDNNSQKWRFWPVLCLAFIFAFASPLLMLATPIYFLDQEVQIKFISLLTIAMTITYSISPILLTRFSNRLGRRKSVIISMIGATSLQMIYYFSLNPFIFLIERLLEGFILGFFFPNLTASISDVPNIDHQKYLSKFNLSWSLAIVFGLIFGAIVLLFTNNLKFIFYISPVIMLGNLLIAILLFKPSISINPESNTKNLEINIKEQKNYRNSTMLTSFYIPVIIPLLFILYSSFAAGNGSFLYPIRSALLGFHPSSTYFVNIFAVIGQTVSIYYSNLLSLNKLKMLTIFTSFVYPFLFLFFIFNEIYWFFIILFMFSGIFYGILYGAASKLFISLNVLKGTSKYSGILESSTGLCYFVSQIFLGFIADIHILLGYLSLSLSLMLLFFINLVFIRKFKEIEEIP